VTRKRDDQHVRKRAKQSIEQKSDSKFRGGNIIKYAVSPSLGEEPYPFIFRDEQNERRELDSCRTAEGAKFL